MNCPKCHHLQSDSNALCEACGLVFEKYYRYNPPTTEPVIEPTDEIYPVEVVEPFSWRKVLLPQQKQTTTIAIYCKAFLLFMLSIYSFKLITSGIKSNYAGETFLHLVNLPFHEAGHVFFGFLGQFMGSLGGTLGQFIMPGICVYVFYFRQEDFFSASVASWWFFENFIDIAPYINDARAGVLPLIGGSIGKHAPYGFHDWEYLLTEMGLLEIDRILAVISHGLGSISMSAAIVWGGVLLYEQYKNIGNRDW